MTNLMEQPPQDNITLNRSGCEKLLDPAVTKLLADVLKYISGGELDTTPSPSYSPLPSDSDMSMESPRSPSPQEEQGSGTAATRRRRPVFEAPSPSTPSSSSEQAEEIETETPFPVPVQPVPHIRAPTISSGHDHPLYPPEETEAGDSHLSDATTMLLPRTSVQSIQRTGFPLHSMQGTGDQEDHEDLGAEEDVSSTQGVTPPYYLDFEEARDPNTGSDNRMWRIVREAGVDVDAIRPSVELFRQKDEVEGGKCYNKPSQIPSTEYLKQEGGLDIIRSAIICTGLMKESEKLIGEFKEVRAAGERLNRGRFRKKNILCYHRSFWLPYMRVIMRLNGVAAFWQSLDHETFKQSDPSLSEVVEIGEQVLHFIRKVYFILQQRVPRVKPEEEFLWFATVFKPAENLRHLDCSGRQGQEFLTKRCDASKCEYFLEGGS
ncbi:hypothetical protein BJ508DRAFT_307342 [Ascobolus immersus RN42]|uniref:Uncharacterized protein n=1 Tax=Ascobolus immersus RN42 TaxID=1160509 RepID=A0A3N4I333_ASCIM|nr:hypothetical protein BJ508DRAFT_307342 [Ascobolus immersus RN42]